MFDIGWSEMLVIAIVVIVVVGPKELPGMLRTFGKTTAKLRVMAGDFRKQFDEALKEAELDDLKKVADDVRALNPKNEIRKAMSPMEQAAKDVRAGFDAAMTPAPKPQPSPEVASANEPAKPAEPAKAGAAAMPGEAVAVVAKPVAAKPAVTQPSAAKVSKPAPVKKAAVASKAPAAKKATAAKPAAQPAPAKAKAPTPTTAKATTARTKTGGAVS